MGVAINTANKLFTKTTMVGQILIYIEGPVNAKMK